MNKYWSYINMTYLGLYKKRQEALVYLNYKTSFKP